MECALTTEGDQWVAGRESLDDCLGLLIVVRLTMMHGDHGEPSDGTESETASAS